MLAYTPGVRGLWLRRGRVLCVPAVSRGVPLTVMSDVLTPDILLQRLAEWGGAPAILTVKGEAFETWSYARLAETTARLATGLIAAGVAPGDAVALYGPNRPEWVAARFAIGACGALAAPVDDLLPEAEVLPLIRDSGARLLFTNRSHLAGLRAADPDLDLACYLLDADGQGAENAQSWANLMADAPGDLPAVEADTPATLVYTSGTTGAPKSFTLSYANISANVDAITREGLIGPGDRVLLPLPLDNVYPYLVGLLTTLNNGATVVFPEEITGPQVVRALHLSEATVMIGVPRLYAAMVTGLQARIAAQGPLPRRLFARLLKLSIALQRRFGLRPGRLFFGSLHRRLSPALRLLVSGGARLDPTLIWTLEGLGWTVRSGYGLAEVSSVFTANLPGRKKIGTEGHPLHPGSLRIAAPDEEGTGEIQLKGPSVFAGYRNNPAANAAAFTDDGWFRTGDLGRVDEAGFVHITGRVKEMIVLGGGKNVFPEELEKVYAGSPFIAEAAVLERDGALVGLVVPDLDAIRDSGYARIEEIIRVALAECAATLPSFQRLSGFAVVREPLPRTRLGKYQRFLLPALYETAVGSRAPAQAKPLSEADRAFLAEPDIAPVWQFLVTRYPDTPLNPDANPQLDLGIDSLEWVTLGLELKDRFGVQLDDETIAEITTLRALLEAVRAAPTAPRTAPSVVEARETWLSPIGPGLRALHAVIHALNRVLMRLLFRLRSEDSEMLPRAGPCLLVVNHASDLDPLVLAAALPTALRRQVYWGGDIVRLFAGPLRRRLARALHVFPVDERAAGASLSLAAAVLDQGDALAWFPESWRSPDGKLQPFFPGVGTLVQGFEGPVHPVYIAGSFAAMPRSRRWPRLRPITVIFGPAVNRADWPADEIDPAAIAEHLRAAVARLEARASR